MSINIIEFYDLLLKSKKSSIISKLYHLVGTRFFSKEEVESVIELYNKKMISEQSYISLKNVIEWEYLEKKGPFYYMTKKGEKEYENEDVTEHQWMPPI